MQKTYNDKATLDTRIDYYIKSKLAYGDYRIWFEYKQFFTEVGKEDFFHSLNWIISDTKHDAALRCLHLQEDEFIEIIYARLANLRPDGTMHVQD